MRYERLDDEEKLKMVPIMNNYNDIDVVNDSERDDDTKNDNKNFFDEDSNDEVKETPETTHQNGTCNEKTTGFV